VERAHTKSLDANDKLLQTRSHVRDTIASRKRQVIMRKGKSTIIGNTAFSFMFHCMNLFDCIFGICLLVPFLVMRGFISLSLCLVKFYLCFSERRWQ